MNEPTNDNPTMYEFDGYRLDVEKRLVFNAEGQSLPLKSKAFDTLLFLVKNPGRVIERDEIMDAVWPETVVEENNLTQHISSLRRIFGESKDDHRFIVTVPGRGYKFAADVRASVVSTRGGDADTRMRGATTPDPIRRFWHDRAVLISFGVFVLLVLIATTGFYVLEKEHVPADRPPITSLAILPFKPIDPENRNVSLEMGMADELIRKLGAIENLRVSPLADIRKFDAIDQDPIEAGHQLHVDAVLEGSIQSADNVVLISVILRNVSDGKQIWTKSFKNDQSSTIINLQNMIAEQIANKLQVPLGTRIARDYTASSEAFTLYSQGKYFQYKLTKPEVEKAIDFYNRAIAIDPEYTLAYVELSIAFRSMVLTGDAEPNGMMIQSRAMASKAVDLDNSLAEAWMSLAITEFWYDRNWQGAEEHFQMAIKLKPESAEVRAHYAHFLSNLGKHDRAIAEINRAVELDPSNPLINAYKGQIYTFADRDDEALEALKITTEMNQGFWLAYLFSSRIYLKKGMYKEAIASATKAKEITNGNAEAMSIIAYAMAKYGNQAGARQILSELESRAKTKYVPAYTLASIHNALDDKENALRMLEKAYEQKDVLMVFLKVEPKWDNLRSDPRFIEILNKMKLNE